MKVAILLTFVFAVTSALPSSRDPVLYGALKYDWEQGYGDVANVHANPPATIAQLIQAMLKAIADWWSDLIEQILKVTATELIKLINATLVALKTLLEGVADELRSIIPQVDDATGKMLEDLINQLLIPAAETIEPIMEQLRQLLLLLPETLAPTQPRDYVSDLVEALLGMTLSEFLFHIKTTVITFDTFLTDSVTLTKQIISQLPPEQAANVEQTVLTTLEKMQRDLLPILNDLGKLPLE